MVMFTWWLAGSCKYSILVRLCENMVPHCSGDSLTVKEMKAMKTRIGIQKPVSKHHAQSMYSAQDVNLKH